MSNFQTLKSKRAKMIAKKPSPSKHVNTVRNFGKRAPGGPQKPEHCPYTQFLLQSQGLGTQEGVSGAHNPLCIPTRPGRAHPACAPSGLQGYSLPKRLPLFPAAHHSEPPGRALEGQAGPRPGAGCSFHVLGPQIRGLRRRRRSRARGSRTLRTRCRPARLSCSLGRAPWPLPSDLWPLSTDRGDAALPGGGGSPTAPTLDWAGRRTQAEGRGLRVLLQTCGCLWRGARCHPGAMKCL